jgi:hypothetical protein
VPPPPGRHRTPFYADELLSSEEQEKLAKLYEEVEREVVGLGVHEQLMARLATLESVIPA